MPTLIAGPRVTTPGTLATGSAVVTVGDTSSIAGALTVAGVGIPLGTYVLSIDDATHFTMTKPATADGPQDLTFDIEVVTLAEAREHLYSCGQYTDNMTLAGMITAARQAIETRCWRAFLTSTWEYTITEFPWRVWPLDVPYITIPNPPLQNIVSLTYVDSTGSYVVMGTTSYGVKTGTPGLVWPAYGTRWPVARNQPMAVALRYVAGYGLADAVNQSTKIAILLMLTHLYENRGDTEAKIPTAIDTLLAPEMWGGVS
jgi:uncharacterized phiE125 gp8 family phage protein